MKYIREYNGCYEWVDISASKALIEIKKVLDRYNIKYELILLQNLKEYEVDMNLQYGGIYQFKLYLDRNNTEEYSHVLEVYAIYDETIEYFDGSNVEIILYYQENEDDEDNEHIMTCPHELIKHLGRLSVNVGDILKKINDKMNYLDSYIIFEKNSKFVNLKNFNLENWYLKLNKSLFGGKLPNVELRWTQSKKELGVVKWDEKSKQIYYLGISTHYQYTQEELLSVLAHEMIHLWQIQNDKTDGHGKEFEKKMIEINKKSKFGIHVLPKQPMEHMKMTNPDLNNDYGFIIIRKGKTDYEIATYDPKKTDYKNLLTIIKQNLKKDQKIEVEVRLTQNGLVKKYKKDSTNNTLNSYKLDELSYNTLVNDSRKIYNY